MRFWLDRPLRIAGTGFCFALFGLLGLIVLCVVFPVLGLVHVGGRDSQTSKAFVRNLFHSTMNWFTQVMIFFGTISVEVRNQEKLNRRGLLLIANHPSLIDVVLLIGLLRRPNCVVKASLKTNLFTRGPVSSAGFVVNSDGAQLVDDCVASVRSGDNLIIFPEGTRSPTHDGALNVMKRGAANIALRGGIDLTPVVIRVSEPMLGKGLRWYQAPVRRPHFILTVMDDIPVSRYVAGEPVNRAARALTRDLEAFFAREVAGGTADSGLSAQRV